LLPEDCRFHPRRRLGQARHRQAHESGTGPHSDSRPKQRAQEHAGHESPESVRHATPRAARRATRPASSSHGWFTRLPGPDKPAEPASDATRPRSPDAMIHRYKKSNLKLWKPSPNFTNLSSTAVSTNVPARRLNSLKTNSTSSRSKRT